VGAELPDPPAPTGRLAVIGGSGLYSMEGLHGRDSHLVDTPFGMTSGPVTTGYLDGEPVIFLARHGEDHSVAPHRINYRANVWALAQAGAGRILAVCSVGGIGPECLPGTLVVPDQIIDYTWGREQTFAEAGDPVTHTDFTMPYSPSLRSQVIDLLEDTDAAFLDGGTYAATQGPRFETAAEISRLARDGCSVVGMTGMPEAVLARELEIAYAAICPVGNLAAGISPDKLSMEEVVDAVAPALDLVPPLVAGLLRGRPRRPRSRTAL
jgi:5'-deoxy-5'-methylthioadenosine phosphorylase